MQTVHYQHEFPYTYDSRGELFPMLQLAVSNPFDPTPVVEMEAYLDCGAQRSLFDGSLARMVGIDLMTGRRLRFSTAAGLPIEAIAHPLRISHPDVGQFEFDVGLTTMPLRRNLLGRDFFNLVQIGFRERHSLFYVTPRP